MSELFKNKGIMNNKLLSLSGKETLEVCRQGAIIVDIREEYLNSYKMFGVDKVIYLPKGRFEQNYKTLPKDEYLVIADSAGLKSKEAASFLIRNGFEKVANLAGGMVEWERDQLPVNTDINERLTGSCMCQLKPRESSK